MRNRATGIRFPSASRRLPVAMLVVAFAAAGAGCGVASRSVAQTAQNTCGEMRQDRARYRDLARLLVDEDRIRLRANTTAQAILGAELGLRRTCRTAAAGFQPYEAAVRSGAVGLVTAP